MRQFDVVPRRLTIMSQIIFAIERATDRPISFLSAPRSPAQFAAHHRRDDDLIIPARERLRERRDPFLIKPPLRYVFNAREALRTVKNSCVRLFVQFKINAVNSAVRVLGSKFGLTFLEQARAWRESRGID